MRNVKNNGKESNKESKKKIAIAVHGGAGADSDHIKKNKKGYEKGLEDAANAGYKVLEEGGNAVEAVEAAVKVLEDNPLFNAGRGSAINRKANVEMCASIMRGDNLNSGAVAIVRNVRNPVSLAKAIMLNTSFIYIGNEGALNYAKEINIPLEPDSYFVTEHQYDVFDKKRREKFLGSKEIAIEQIKERMHGTVGAVAMDEKGLLAAATSTGGTENAREGRIGDSSIIGVGCYANNKTCAVSCTGDGEYSIRGVIAHDISAYVEYKKASLKDAVNYVIHEKNGDIKGDLGVIAVDPKGNIEMAFKADRMHRAWKSSGKELQVKIYE